MDPDVVAKEMRRARNVNGQKLFTSSEFLSAQQVSSFFSRLAAKIHHNLASEEDIRAAEEEENFSSARDSVLSFVDLQHPVVYSTYDVCTLVKEDKLKKLKVNTLREICEALNLEVPSEPIKRKAPYTDLIEDSVKRCTCIGGPPS